MPRAYIDGEFVILSAEQIADLQKLSEQESVSHTESGSDVERVQQLIEGLSEAKTIAQIRSVAKSILEETEGNI